jgi:DNA-directed RNA polymerase subunit RPC12/RpoP
MKITDEMVGAAMLAYMKETAAEEFQVSGWLESAIRASLTAALAVQTQQGVEVKKLEWVQLYPKHTAWPKDWHGTGVQRSRYVVTQNYASGDFYVLGRAFNSLEEAKFHAEVDYAASIRSALVDVPAVAAYYCTDCETQIDRLINNRCPCGSGRVVSAPPRSEVPAVGSEPVTDSEPIAWYMHLWNEADEDIKSDVHWGRPTGDEIARAEHNGHDIEHLYAHLPRSLSNEGWMPIETAPKDRDVILAITREEDGEIWSHVAQGRWIDGEDDQVDQPGHDAGFVDCEYSNFFPGRSFGPAAHRCEGVQPTHWQHLPAPPLSTRKGSAGDGSATGTKGHADE